MGDGGDASRRYLYTPVSITQADNECRLEGDKTHEIFHFLLKKVGGGHFLCGPHQAEKWGGRVPPPPRPPTIYARGVRACVRCVCPHVQARACVRACVRVCVRVYVWGSMRGCMRVCDHELVCHRVY